MSLIWDISTVKKDGNKYKVYRLKPRKVLSIYFIVVSVGIIGFVYGQVFELSRDMGLKLTLAYLGFLFLVSSLFLVQNIDLAITYNWFNNEVTKKGGVFWDFENPREYWIKLD